MKTVVLWLVMIIGLGVMSGCSGKSELKNIPFAEFSEFEYHRGGNATSMDIVAKNAKKVKGGITVQSIVIKADYGPFVNFNIKITDYKLTNDINSVTFVDLPKPPLLENAEYKPENIQIKEEEDITNNSEKPEIFVDITIHPLPASDSAK